MLQGMLQIHQIFPEHMMAVLSPKLPPNSGRKGAALVKKEGKVDYPKIRNNIWALWSSRITNSHLFSPF
jgi:hypothetical protein